MSRKRIKKLIFLKYDKEFAKRFIIECGLCLGFVFAAIFLVSTMGANRTVEIDVGVTSHVDCIDGVVCYYYQGSYGGGMDCIRDVELANEHCKRNNPIIQ